MNEYELEDEFERQCREAELSPPPQSIRDVPASVLRRESHVCEFFEFYFGDCA